MALRVLVAGLFLLIVPASASAQGNYEPRPLGGGSTLRGGTGVALGSDVLVPFLNPAGVANISERSLAISSRFFRYNHRSLVRFHRPGDVDAARFPGLVLSDADVSSNEVDIAPDASCYFEDFGSSDMESTTLSGPRTGRHQLSICLAKTEERELAFEAASVAAQLSGGRVDLTQSLLSEFDRREIAIDYATYFSERLAIGVGVHGVTSNDETLSAGSMLLDQSGAGSEGSFHLAADGRSWGLVLSLGAIYRFGDTLTIGASFRAPEIHVTGTYDRSLSIAGQPGTVSTRVEEGGYQVNTPMRVGLGIGLSVGRLRVELDGSFHPGVDEYIVVEGNRRSAELDTTGVVTRTEEPFRRVEPAAPIVNVAVGAEYFVADDLSLMAGFGTDYGSLRPFEEGNFGDRAVTTSRDSFRASLGVGFYGPLGELLVGLWGAYSSGESLVLNQLVTPPASAPIRDRQFELLLVLSGRIDLARAQQLVERLAGEPTSPEPGDAQREQGDE